ncbi:MAG: hypothetical protein JOZ51_05335 [Chloroflexi bacterium]|nr:hypothetical protein [Chloroflexota bacterium]
MVFRPHRRSLGLKPTRPLVSALILSLMLSTTAFNPVQPQAVEAKTAPRPDLGDAPDSNNNFAVAMQYFPSSGSAQFPTVFFAGTQPTGPKHFNTQTLYFLGTSSIGGGITCEDQADVGADCDGPNNLDPGANVADQDRGDDGPDWTSLGPITGCQPMQYKYLVTVLPGAPTTAYVNSWYDFNQSGRWGDIFPCGRFTVDEWIVQNQLITFPGPGVYAFATPVFQAAQNPSTDRRWARITLSDTPLPNTVPSHMGSGPAQGWVLGETEDYQLLN